MSTEYYTIPGIRYEDFVQKCSSVKLVTPKEKIFVLDSMTLCNRDSYLHAFEREDGDVGFVRFGKNSIHQIFPFLIKEFGFQVYDEHHTGVCLD